MPEPFNLDTAYSDPTLNDAVAESHVSYIGWHLYDAQMKTCSLAVEKNRMTDFCYNGENVGSLIQMAKNIMNCLKHQMNAYVALNQNNSATPQTSTISRGAFANVHQYTTSASKKLSDEGPWR